MREATGALALALGLLLSAYGDAPLQRMDPASVDPSGWSEMGRTLLTATEDGSWGRTPHFILRAVHSEALDQLAEEAEHAYAYMAKTFPGTPSPEEPARLIQVARASAWTQFTRAYQLRTDGLAIQIGREIYLKDDLHQQARPDRIAHEIVHLRLHEQYGDQVPLWLEEGLAGYFGWACAKAYMARRGVVLNRTPPAFTTADLMAFEAFIRQDRYPRDPVKAQAFYRQGEALVGSLVEHLGRNDLHKFVTRWCEAPPEQEPMERFRHASRVDPEQERAIIEGMQKRFLSTSSSF